MSPIQSFQILLADDDEDDTFLFQEALAQIPVTTDLTTADNGMELMKKLSGATDIPDLIFLDVNMPVKNGLECLAEIRDTARFSQTPVVILSTSIAENLLESAFRGGANLYIQKPTSFSSLISIIQKCILQREELLPGRDLEQFLIKNSSSK
jgi:CheY-like chemotaxis protein